MMNQEDIFKKVGQILKELQDQYEFLAQNPGQLNELELELFLANANFLTDHVHIVKKINSNRPLKAIPEHTQEPLPNILPPKAPEMSTEKTLDQLSAEHAERNEEETTLKFQFKLDEEAHSDKFDFEEKTVEAIFDRPLSKEEEDIIAQKQRVMAQQPPESSGDESLGATKEVHLGWEPDKIEEKLASEASVAPVPDKVEEKVVQQPEFIHNKPTINDMLAGNKNYAAGLNEENNRTPITDLKQAINLNQKLIFIKDLFNGYNLAYAEAIDLVNKMPDFKTADAFLQQNYAVKNNWSAKQSTVDQFYELLNQRFPAK